MRRCYSHSGASFIVNWPNCLNGKRLKLWVRSHIMPTWARIGLGLYAIICWPARRISSYSPTYSIDHYRKALTSADHLPSRETLVQRQQIHADLGELLLTIGRNDEGQEHLLSALDSAEELNNPEAQAFVCRWMARAYEVRGQYPPALEWIDRGLAILGDKLTPAALELRNSSPDFFAAR